MRFTSLIPPALHWECPNCITRHVTNDARPHTPFHNCPGLHGLTAPLVVRGTRCKVEARVRDDYVGNEDVTFADGRPIMSVVTTRDDGQDCAVLAPSARAFAE